MPFQFPENNIVPLPKQQSWPESVHILDEREMWALKAAYYAQRPLLIRGEPGCGKSQLARVAAQVMNRAFISEVVHGGAEPRDLQYRFDAVARLGEAQLLGHLKAGEEIKDALDHLKFLEPGPLWWALNWKDAKDQQVEHCQRKGAMPEEPEGWEPKQGCVLLIDEIDKAEAELPNGLLETLGNGAFSVPYRREAVVTPEGCPPPLVVITTNEERALPAAFMRRCLVLHHHLPENEGDLIEWLMKRGDVHPELKVDATVRRMAAELLVQDRADAQRAGEPTPGLAEFLDLLRALTNLGDDATTQREALSHIAQFATVKHKKQDQEPLNLKGLSHG